MLDKPGLYMMDSGEAERIADECRQSGWRVFCLPTGIASKDGFFDAIRSACPLDPPLYSNRSWDALADSLWSGLDEVEDEKIIILWKNADCMKAAAPECFDIATNILGDLCASLADSSVAAFRTKRLLVFQGLS
jgi:hypothetical protein